MSRVALDRIRRPRSKSSAEQGPRDLDLHAGEMMKKTPIRRIAKRLPLSPAVQAMLARDEEIDYDTPVERVPDPKREALRDRISERTAGLRGDRSTEESDGSSLDGAGRRRPAGGGWRLRPSPPAAPRLARAIRGWRRLHAVGNERGYDHDALHEWADKLYKVDSLTDLTTKQRGEFMHRSSACRCSVRLRPPVRQARRHGRRRSRAVSATRCSRTAHQIRPASRQDGQGPLLARLRQQPGMVPPCPRLRRHHSPRLTLIRHEPRRTRPRRSARWSPPSWSSTPRSRGRSTSWMPSTGVACGRRSAWPRTSRTKRGGRSSRARCGRS